ncbi:MAG: protein kinase domain-containing protein [Planctomycetota bacterium]|jgi:hypothetical protein
MTLTPDTRLGPYEIVSSLGKGGMGVVYRATDTKLKREVAIKVLPAAFTQDQDRLARFEREAQLLAQLHHPNIASIFGLEESRAVQALVMELAGGFRSETLPAGHLTRTSILMPITAQANMRSGTFALSPDGGAIVLTASDETGSWSTTGGHSSRRSARSLNCRTVPCPAGECTWAFGACQATSRW